MFRPNVIPPERRRESSLELSISRKDRDFEFFGISKVKFEKLSFRFSHCTLDVAGVVLCPTYHTTCSCFCMVFEQAEWTFVLNKHGKQKTMWYSYLE